MDSWGEEEGVKCWKTLIFILSLGLEFIVMWRPLHYTEVRDGTVKLVWTPVNHNLFSHSTGPNPSSLGLSNVITIIKHIKLEKMKWQIGSGVLAWKYRVHSHFFREIRVMALEGSKNLNIKCVASIKFISFKQMFSSLTWKFWESFIKWTKLCLSSIWLQNFNWFLNFSTLLAK